MAKKQGEKKQIRRSEKSRTRKGANVRAQAKQDAPDAAAAEAEPAAANNALDPRLPAPGTVLQKVDRHGAVRCECTIEEAGFRYAGEVYRSLSAAAMAAAKDLGLANKTQNGFAFFGLSKSPRHQKDQLAALERVWERYHGRAEALVKSGITPENRNRVVEVVRKHEQLMEDLVTESLREKVA